MSQQSTAWWDTAVIYQVYPRSFADADGDGIGDIDGLRARLPYLRGLGVDALWVGPWYDSPMADGGYDIANHRHIDRRFGTLAGASRLMDEIHALGMRIIVDLVPNHCSTAHPWFQEALAAAPGSAERRRFHFRDGRGEHGELPPNNWLSSFGGSAWERIVEPDGRQGQWYLHLFAREQPDFNWDNAQVRAEFDSILRFWLDRGVDGFRVDVADRMVKKPGLPDSTADDPWPYADQPGVHEIYREWRRLVDSYPGERMLVGELWLAEPDHLPSYTRPDELHTAFDFPLTQCAWRAADLRSTIERSLAEHAEGHSPAVWVLCNHDVIRPVTRYGRVDTRHAPDGYVAYNMPTDLELGTRRARAAALLTLALPGSVYLYQGDELGLWEVDDLPEDVRQDPVWLHSNRSVYGRDGCRVPLPWSGEAPPFGFSDPDAAVSPWLPQPAAWKGLTAEAQAGRPDSMLELYRSAIRIRRAENRPDDQSIVWLDMPPGVLAFRRRGGLVCVVNTQDKAVRLPPHGRVLLATEPIQDGMLAAHAAAWLHTS